MNSKRFVKAWEMQFLSIWKWSNCKVFGPKIHNEGVLQQPHNWIYNDYHSAIWSSHTPNSAFTSVNMDSSLDL